MVGIKVWLQPEANKTKWDEAKLTVPIIGKVIQYGIYVQWLQTLGNLLSNGVPLVQALQLTSETVTNRYFRGRLHGITEGSLMVTVSLAVCERPRCSRQT